jgi:hypothetical protein
MASAVRLGWGRRAILDLAASVCRQPGRFNDSYQTRLHHRTRPGRHRQPDLADLLALMASSADYDPDHEAARGAVTLATDTLRTVLSDNP